MCSRPSKKTVLCILICLGGLTGTTLAAEVDASAIRTEQQPSFRSLIVDPITFHEPYDTGWQLYFDNDLFTGTNTDRDYTGGFAVAFSGRRAREWWFSMDAWLDWVDTQVGVQNLQTQGVSFLRHTMEFGLVMLTPENLTTPLPQLEDHPFGNFLFVANSQQVTFTDKRFVLHSALTVGLIGTQVGEKTQSLIHSATGSDTPVGWDNQISEGGELTGKYSVMAQKNLAQRYGQFSYEVSGALEANVGFNTDLAFSLSTRMGQLRSPWWSFSPHQSDYINLGQTITSRIDDRILPAELFAWAGVKAKYSAYNGFLQGQFRNSAVKFGHDELVHDIYEAWLGVTKTWTSGFGISFFVRNRSGEIKGPDRRDPLWSGFIVSFTS